MLTDNEAAATLSEALKPGVLRQRYLKNWLQNNRSTTLLDTPLWVQLGFTLPAHDTASDAIRALWVAGQCERASVSVLAGIKEELK